ncbi:MAK10-like protein [Tanacetum coccineum]
MISFLSTVVSSRFSTTNNQFRGENDHLLLVLLEQGLTSQEQYPKPKWKRDATWFRDKVLLDEAQGNSKVLNKEEFEFLVGPGIPEGLVTQTVITHNAAYQAYDFDAYDSYYDDFSTAKAVLMANVSSYGSDVLSKNEITSDSNIIPYSQYLLEIQNAAVLDTNSPAQKDAMILSVFEQLSNQLDGGITGKNAPALISIFPFADQASNWLESLPAGYIRHMGGSSTGSCSILSHQGRTVELRNDILMSKPSTPSPQPQALGTTFEARVRGYMAAHTERMERFKNIIFKQREEINDRMTEKFGLLKELTTCRTPEKVLVREEAKFLITKNVNSISLVRGEEEGSDKMDETLDNTVKPTVTETEIPVKEAERNNETKNKPKKGPELGRIAEDILVEVAEHVYLLDFMIFYIKENKKRPFILGTPFLTTAKAAIKFDKGTITLRSGKSKISFHRIPDSPYMTEKGVKNDIKPIAPTMTVNRLVLEWEEKIKLHLEREMEFNQWRSKNF